MSASRITAFIFVVMVLAACAASANAADEPIIVLDSGRSHEFAKARCSNATEFFNKERDRITKRGCANVPSCGELKPAFNACANDPNGGVSDFEDRLTTQLATDPKCKGVQFLKYNGPNGVTDNVLTDAMRSSHWKMTIDYLPGAQKQPWSLLAYESKGLIVGDGNPKDIASQLCFILNDRGVRHPVFKKPL